MSRSVRLYSIFAAFAGLMLLAQSCSTSKACGCGSDLNRVYRSSRR